MSEIKFMQEIFHDPTNPLDSSLTNLLLSIGDSKIYICYTSIIRSKCRLYEIDYETKEFRFLDIPVKTVSEFNFSLIQCMCLFPSDEYILCGCSGGNILVIDICRWKLEGIKKIDMSSSLGSARRFKLCIPLDETHVALSDDSIVLILKMEADSSSEGSFGFSCESIFRKHQDYRRNTVITEIETLREPDYIVSASGIRGLDGSNEILIWNWKTMKVESIFPDIHSPNYLVESIKEEYSARGHIFFSSAYQDNKPCEVCEWDSSGNCLRKLLFPDMASKILFGSTRFAIAEKKYLQLAVVDLFVGKVTNIINLKKILNVGKKSFNRELIFFWRDKKSGYSELIVNAMEKTCLVNFSFQANLDESERIDFIGEQYWNDLFSFNTFHFTVNTKYLNIFK